MNLVRPVARHPDFVRDGLLLVGLGVYMIGFVHLLWLRVRKNPNRRFRRIWRYSWLWGIGRIVGPGLVVLGIVTALR